MARVTYNAAPLRRYTASLPGRGRRTANRAAQRGAEVARDAAPVRTGALREGIGAEDGRMVSAAPYSRYVNDGTYKMAANPFFDQGIEQARRDLPGIAREEFAP